MVYALLLAHLLGDFVFQTDAVARWKSRSVLGVLVHGAIVTVSTLLCTIWFGSKAWLISVAIGVSHTGIDLVRSRVSHKELSTSKELWLLMGDQALHLIAIWIVLWLAGNPAAASLSEMLPGLFDPRWQAIAIGYCLLTTPAWVAVRFTVRGLWGDAAAPPLTQGDKYGCMLERLLIATCILIEQPIWVPIVVAIRPVLKQQERSTRSIVAFDYPAQWAETMLSTSVAVFIGVFLRIRI